MSYCYQLQCHIIHLITNTDSSRNYYPSFCVLLNIDSNSEEVYMNIVYNTSRRKGIYTICLFHFEENLLIWGKAGTRWNEIIQKCPIMIFWIDHSKRSHNSQHAKYFRECEFKATFLTTFGIFGKIICRRTRKISTVKVHKYHLDTELQRGRSFGTMV